MPSVNNYFDNKVTSIAFQTATKPATVGVMEIGEYEFGTDAHELMEILSGELEVLLPGSTDWQPVSGGFSFEVPANSKFQVKIHAMINYCCSYG